MRRGPTGTHLTVSTAGGERVSAFLPAPLPPTPPLDIDAGLRELLDQSLLELGRLDSVTTLLPGTHLFLYTYVRKEAVLSSQIEGTQSSLSDLLLFEAEDAPGVPLDEVSEVSRYVDALEHGLKRIGEGFPLSTRLIREMHGILLSSGRGSTQDPGEFRRSQNWIGGQRPGDASFVPPPAHLVPEYMGAWEEWLHDRPARTPPLIKAALAHVQFESIHPFLDGNGRVGRLLITLLLTVEGVLRDPLLYLSLYFKRQRAEYYRLLDAVRADGDWEAWLAFFAVGVRESAAEAVATARQLVDRAAEDADRIRSIPRLAGSGLRVHRALQERPIASAKEIGRLSGLSGPAVNKTLAALATAGIAREVTGRRRNRLFSYEAYVGIMNRDTEPLPR